MNWVLFGVSLVTALLAAISLLVVRAITDAKQTRRVVLIRAQNVVREDVAVIQSQEGLDAIHSSRAPPDILIPQHLRKGLSLNDPQ